LRLVAYQALARRLTDLQRKAMCGLGKASSRQVDFHEVDKAMALRRYRRFAKRWASTTSG
jgi:hypothetical protein